MSNSFLDRVGNVVKSEWNARFGDDGEPLPKIDDEAYEKQFDLDATRVDAKVGGRVTSPADLPLTHHTRTRRRGVSEAAQAYRLLELSDDVTLDVVRAQYFKLAQRYHPRTIGKNADKAYAAQTVLETLTDALEILEAHLLPLSPSSTNGASD